MDDENRDVAAPSVVQADNGGTTESISTPPLTAGKKPSDGDGAAHAVGPANRYEREIDLDSESTHARVVRLVGTGRRVLELGPATGHMSRMLRDRDCSVVGIEVDEEMAAQAAQYCERVIVGDLDTIGLDEELGSDRFDVIVAADVLEHLRDPLSALRRLREFLAPGGFFVISLPNVAHGSVRLALLEGHFQYQRLGLLDATHLRFFTRESIEELLDEADLAMAEIYHQQLNIDASEVPFDRDAVSAEVMEQLKQDPDAQTYQFVIRAIPFELPGMRAMQRRMRDLATEVARLNEENSRLRETGRQLQELQGALAAIAGKEGQLRASLLDTHEQLFQRDQEISQLRAELLPLRRTLDSLRASQLGAAYLKIRRARRIASKVRDRIARYRNSLRQL
jgi:O-antigen biosynthesis protein